MAKLCSPYGTSPVTSFFNELTTNSFSDDFHHIQPDSFDFLEDLPSIYGDIQKIESDGVFSTYGNSMDLECDIKPEIRNTDLMWSGLLPNSLLSTSASSTLSDIAAAPLASVMGDASPTGKQIKKEGGIVTKQQQQQQQQQRPPPTIVVAKKLNHKNLIPDIIIKQEPIDDVEQQLEHHSIPNNKTVATTSMQNIPPGTSLLRKSNQIQQQQQQQKKLQQTRGTLHITKRGDLLLPSTYSPMTPTASATSVLNTSTSSSCSLSQRPDTPHSLDDDCSTPEFRHNVDLRACVMGSNNISLTADPTHYIHNVSQELQDTSKKQIDIRLLSDFSLNEVLDVINNSAIQDATLTPSASSSSSSSSSSSCSSSSSSGFNDLSINTSGLKSSSDFYSDEESLHDHDITYGAGGVSPVSCLSSNMSSTTLHYMQHSDHSYTRCKDGMDDLSTNLETPSDSEEEIDVVSINDKKLPTNPSDKDRRVIQIKVADKFNEASIVKTPNGIRTIPPRRRGCYELPETPATPASSSPVKSVNNSRFPSPATTPFQNQYTTKFVQQQQQMMAVVLNNSSSSPIPINVVSSSVDKSRKRLLANATSVNATIINSSEITSVTTMPPSKKHRGKKTKHLVTAVQLPNGILKRHYSIDETADTIEKRNLHNDMERQRRIGLKNLFESLKKQIPSIKDKERAPKVNILREAAKLCEALTRDDHHLTEQKAKLKEDLKRNQALLAQLRAHLRD